jgi:DNA-binding response OmpR family regulator
MPRILIVEDEVLLSLMLTDWLEELSYSPIGPAHSVSSALELIDEQELDAAILDLSVAGDDTSTVARALRSKGIPFAFSTGHGASLVPVEFSDAPVLPKPYNLAKMGRTLATLLAGGSVS